MALSAVEWLPRVKEGKMIAHLRKLKQDSRFVRQMVSDCFRTPAAPPRAAVVGDNCKDEWIWLGHASFYLSLEHTTFLLDPVLFNRVGPSLGPITFGIKRLVGAPVRATQLPRLDFLLISHAHFDHLDIRSLRCLARGNAPKVVLTSQGASKLLRPIFNAKTEIRELTDDRPYAISSETSVVCIRARLVNHRGSRWRGNTHQKTNAYIIQAGSRRVLYVGDIAHDAPTLEWLRVEEPVDVAFLPIGAYNPFLHHHVSPEQAVEIALASRAKILVPHHHSTFALSYEPLTEPLERLVAAAQGHDFKLAIPALGERSRLTTP